jgi:hypothetical protein
MQTMGQVGYALALPKRLEVAGAGVEAAPKSDVVAGVAPNAVAPNAGADAAADVAPNPNDGADAAGAAPNSGVAAGCPNITLVSVRRGVRMAAFKAMQPRGSGDDLTPRAASETFLPLVCVRSGPPSVDAVAGCTRGTRVHCTANGASAPSHAAPHSTWLGLPGDDGIALADQPAAAALTATPMQDECDAAVCVASRGGAAGHPLCPPRVLETKGRSRNGLARTGQGAQAH